MLEQLIRTSEVLHDPAQLGTDVLGVVLASDGGTLIVTSHELDGGVRQHKVRGRWPDANEGDPVLLRVLEHGLWAIGWEPSNTTATPRVAGATTEARRKGLATMSRIWTIAAPYYGRAGQLMPRVRFNGGVDALFVGWSTNPPGDLASILATGRMEWPDWVNHGLIGIHTSDDDLDADAARELLIHEWAHAFQKPGLSMVQAEGGAQAFTRRFAPEIYAAIGVTYVNPPLGDDQYTMPDDTTDSGHANGATGWVEEHMGEEWIVDGQFR